MLVFTVIDTRIYICAHVRSRADLYFKRILRDLLNKILSGLYIRIVFLTIENCCVGNKNERGQKNIVTIIGV